MGIRDKARIAELEAELAALKAEKSEPVKAVKRVVKKVTESQ